MIGDANCFSGPDSVNTMPDGTLCVADTANKRLQVIRPSGEVLRTVQFRQSLGELKFHTGLAADADAFYVVDNANHALRKLALADGAAAPPHTHSAAPSRARHPPPTADRRRAVPSLRMCPATAPDRPDRVGRHARVSLACRRRADRAGEQVGLRRQPALLPRGPRAVETPRLHCGAQHCDSARPSAGAPAPRCSRALSPRAARARARFFVSLRRAEARPRPSVPIAPALGPSPPSPPLHTASPARHAAIARAAPRRPPPTATRRLAASQDCGNHRIA
eukprot:7389150-Prymnesium_polylepis.1